MARLEITVPLDDPAGGGPLGRRATASRLNAPSMKAIVSEASPGSQVPPMFTRASSRSRSHQLRSAQGAGEGRSLPGRAPRPGESRSSVRARSSAAAGWAAPAPSRRSSVRSSGRRSISTAHSTTAPAPGREAVRRWIDDVPAPRDPHDRDDSPVDPRREPLVDSHLLAAEVLAPRERELLDEAEVDRLLRLVDELPGEEDVGDVGLDELDGVRAVGVGAGIAQIAHPRREARVAHRATVWSAAAGRQSGAPARRHRRRPTPGDGLE